jgi:hypothetical protein
MTEPRPTYGVGEVIYPRQGLPPCQSCHDSSKVHRYTVVSDTQMAPSGCDGEEPFSACACRRYEAPEGTVLPGGTKAPPSRAETWERYPNDAMSILAPKEAPLARCRQALCMAPVWWGVTAAHQKRCPFDITPDGVRTGTSHWRTCRDRPTNERGRQQK